jgi:hypothetical protein
MIFKTIKHNCYFHFQCYWIFSVLFFSFFFTQNLLKSQTTASSRKTISAEFRFEEVEFRELAYITNVLKVRNNNGRTYTFTISLNVPSGWKSLVDETKEYTLKPNDSVFVPVRMLTNNKKAKGGTKYSISAYINTNEGKQMAYARFMAGRPKVSNWNMHILPMPRIYFLNGDNNSSFQVHVANDGDESEDIILSSQKIGKDLVLKDSANNIIKKNFTELKLRPFSDTTLSYNVSILQDVRNERRIDTWSYHPYEIQREKRYSLFLRANEVRLENSSTQSKSKKVDFIKLANSIDFIKLSNTTQVGNGSNTIPLSLFFNVSNILGQQPIAFINLQGNSQIAPKTILNYTFQTGFLYYRYSDSFYKDQLNGNITVTRKKAWIGVSLGGRNFKSLLGGYTFNSNHSINGFIQRSRFFGTSTFNRFGLNYFGRAGIFSFNTFANLNSSQGTITSYQLQNTINIVPSRFLSFNLTGGIWQFNFIPGIFTRNLIYGGGVNYYHSRYSTSCSAFITEINQFSGNNLIAKAYNYNFSLNNNYNSRKGYSINLSNQLQVINNNFFQDQSTFQFINQLSLTPSNFKRRKINYSPLLFLNLLRVSDNLGSSDTLMQGGLQFNYSHTSFEKQLFYGGMTRLGYSGLLDQKDKGAFFNLSTNVFARYKVFNFMFLYNYGGFGFVDMALLLKNLNGVYPQTVRMNLGHQFQFKNKHFVWENNPTYMYMNTLKRHSLGLFSQFFYFTDNNWRFTLNASINYIKGISLRYNPDFANGMLPITESEQKMVMTKNAQFGFTAKKDFAIPIPKRFRNNKFCDAKLLVFLDINGNHRKDEGEVPVENVVLRLNEFEVITDENGMGSFINTSFAKYHLQVLPLMDMGTWFPNISDSIDVCGPEVMFVPFSKGVQVYGVVELDRELYSGELFDKLDVSRFKIYLVDSTGRTFSSITDNRGNFNFYVPYAKYTLKFDEKALGSSFYLPENDIPLDLRSGIESYYHHFLIIEKKRRVKKKIFGPDGKVIIVEENATSQNSGKNNQNNSSVANNTGKNNTGKTGTSNNTGKNGTGNNNSNQNGFVNDQITIINKEQQLDSLIDLLNKLISRMATKADVRAIVKQELQTLMDELNATFTIKIDELAPGKSPTGLLLQLVRLNKVEQIKTKSGATLYFSGDYNNINEAERFCRDYQTSGFRNAKVVKRQSMINSNK